MQIANPILPGRMTAEERLDEIAHILAAGLIRLRTRKSSGLSRDDGESSLDFSPDESGHGVADKTVGENKMTDSVLARVAALKTTPTPALKAMWRDLFETEPPPYNRRFLESRLAYRIQELAYGGLKPETIKRLEAIAAELDGGTPCVGDGQSRIGRFPGPGLFANGRASSTA